MHVDVVVGFRLYRVVDHLNTRSQISFPEVAGFPILQLELATRGICNGEQSRPRQPMQLS